MKRLKENQKHGCYWCRQEGIKTQAIWREKGCLGMHACEKHRPDLEKKELADARRDNHVSEADYQTWWKI